MTDELRVTKQTFNSFSLFRHLFFSGPVKEHAQANPHKLYPFPEDSKTHVAHMTEGDFFSSEKSCTVPAATSVRIEVPFSFPEFDK